MEYVTLGKSDLHVSNVCLGTMTWGKQNTQADADSQLQYALKKGINFIDTAEMYAIPPSAETYGKTENIIGNWLARNPGRRKEIVLATKIAGNGLPWVRGGADVTGAAIISSVDASLKRLQTDHIDLYQIHWPDRGSQASACPVGNPLSCTDHPFGCALPSQLVVDLVFLPSITTSEYRPLRRSLSYC